MTDHGEHQTVADQRILKASGHRDEGETCAPAPTSWPAWHRCLAIALLVVALPAESPVQALTAGGWTTTATVSPPTRAPGRPR